MTLYDVTLSCPDSCMVNFHGRMTLLFGDSIRLLLQCKNPKSVSIKGLRSVSTLITVFCVCVAGYVFDSAKSILSSIFTKHERAIELLGLPAADGDRIKAVLENDFSDIRDLLKAVSLVSFGFFSPNIRFLCPVPPFSCAERTYSS